MTGALLLTQAMALASDGLRVEERRARSMLSKLAHARKAAREMRDHRLAMEVAMMREGA